LIKIEFIAERDEISGFGSYISHQFEPFIIMNELERAVSKASHYGKVVEVEPGDYEVILEPEASSEFVELFSIYGFGAKMYQEGRSYISDKMGAQVFSPNVDLFDSSQEEGQIRIPFDFEGVSKQKVPLITKGVVSGVVYDTETARKEGKKSTGHALPLPNPHGPAPINLCFSPGNRTLEQMISKVERGILITRLNYTNIEDEKNGVITGMTRDGTFFIEKGEVAEPVYDLRFTQSVPEALKRVTEVGSETKLVSPLFGYSLFPAIKIDGFKITGAKKRK
ncbi:MAG: TldD/PmbA family protein, partial [Actinobacteria bacterium]|nr:TldD/PmbA family protein [Actinomycetota bacterium]